ncbi:hypothetical protein GCM10009599_26990 [Luteococcus peritonei]
MRYPLVAFVKLWRRLLSPLYGDVCKYHPSCSAYGLTALETHGAIYGSWLTVWRILRCNPFSKGGYDPVPGTAEDAAWQTEQAERRLPTTTVWSDALASGISHNTRGEY